MKANPPKSRIGDRSDFDGSAERQISAAKPSKLESPRQHFAKLAAKPPQAEAAQIIPPTSQQIPAESSKGSRRQEAAISNEVTKLSGMLSATRDVPEAFPEDEISKAGPSFFQSVATSYSTSKLNPRVDSKPRSGLVEFTKEPSYTTSEKTLLGNDPFVTANNTSRTFPTTKDDFNSAFLGIGNKGKASEQGDSKITNGFKSVNISKSYSEFPPIQEFNTEDKSDSDEDRGFDDNFTAHSANRTAESEPSQALQAPPVSDSFRMAPNRPPFETANTTNSPLPTPGAQASPPTYDQTVGSLPGEAPHRRESNQFPAEYSDLLPSRVDPTSLITSPPPQTAATQPITSTAGINRGLNFFGEDTTEQGASHATIGSFSHEHASITQGAAKDALHTYIHTSSPPQ